MDSFYNSKAYRHHLNVLCNELSCEELIESGLANPFRVEEELQQMPKTNDRVHNK